MANANILLYKSKFLIKNSYTAKQIPFLWDGSTRPKLVYISESEIASNFAFEGTDGDNTKYSEYAAARTSPDDWGNLLSVEDFPNSESFAPGSEYNVPIPYTLNDKMQFNYGVTGNTNSDWQKYNTSYEMQDVAAIGAARVWKSSTGTYIKYVGNRWVITDNPNMASLPSQLNYAWNNICSYSKINKPDIQDLSTLSWEQNYYYFSGSFSMKSTPVQAYGDKTFWMVIGDYDDSSGSRVYKTSNVVSFILGVLMNEITNVSMSIAGSTGSANYTGFYKDDTGRMFPTDMVSVAFSASASTEIRIRFSGGILVKGYNYQTPYTETGITKKTGFLAHSMLGSTDTYFTLAMYVQDEAGNEQAISQNITNISRLWRMIGTNIKEDDASYQTKFFSVLSTSSSLEIPKSKTSSEEFTRNWEDIFYPTNHGYPRNSDGTIIYNEALRISKPLDESGINGPTTEELTMYDQLQLTSDGSALATDSDDRYMTSGWQRNKLYNRMESSSYGESGENLRYWVIDNTGNSDLKLEFEYFDLDNQISNIPPNILSPYDGDVLVVYDAQAEGCLKEIIDIYGNKTYQLQDSSLLVELFAFSGSCYTEDIKMKSGAGLPITQTGNGFNTSSITTTSKICIIFYTDNDYQASGFKIKAGPRHNVIFYNYDLNNTTGEVWVHQEPGTTMNRWYSPSRMTSTHQYLTSNATFDFEEGILTLDTRSGSTITGAFTVYNYLFTDGSTATPTTYFTYSDAATGMESNPELSAFLLYHDDCIDYYEISICVVPTGITPNYTDIYSFQDEAYNYGKIVSNFETNKDKGTIKFTSTVPLGRIFASYSYHSYYRLTNDGYGDLFFYDNALVPSSDYATTGLRDWTYVDLVIYNEGSNSLSEGIMKFMSRGYIEGSGSSQVVTQVVDENRPWDVQSGTIAETVNRTGASFSASYSGLAAKTRGAAVNAINNTSSGGVSFGQTLLPRSKAYIRLYWCLAQSDAASPSYVVTTRGKKLWSSELSGKYFVVTV